MIARLIDLARVREALARLDQAAREYPELTGAAARDRLDAWIAAEKEGQHGWQAAANDV